MFVVGNAICTISRSRKQPDWGDEQNVMLLLHSIRYNVCGGMREFSFQGRGTHYSFI
jgi:hypothetical protein